MLSWEKSVVYGYYMRISNHVEWWDNRPHHPEISTFPHHRHIGDRVEKLENPDLSAFIEKCSKSII